MWLVILTILTSPINFDTNRNETFLGLLQKAKTMQYTNKTSTVNTKTDLVWIRS
jgi:hypothetical protein